MWTLKYGIDDLIYERDSQTKMTDLWLLGRWGGGGEQIRSLEVAMQSVIYSTDKQQGHIVQYKEQYSVSSNKT